MPGGYKRGLDGGDEDALRVIDAVDRLLAGEFSNIDVVSIMNITNEVYRLVTRVLAAGDYQNQRQTLEEKIELVDREKEKLRPIFNRMLELGFDPVILTR